jgi:hypothetical protein
MGQTTYHDRLTADELRNIKEDTYIVVELHEEEYWQQAEGHVSSVTRYDGGETVVHIKGGRGHPAKLRIPKDARKGLRYTHGAAQGANNLRVERVYER